MITRVERLSMKVTSDSESIAREACDSLRSKSDSRWKPRWDEMGATARDAVHRCRTHGLALPPNWAGVCKLHIDLKCSTPTCVELLTYVVNLVWCATHFGRCVDLRIMCHTSPFGECAAVRISSSRSGGRGGHGARDTSSRAPSLSSSSRRRRRCHSFLERVNDER